jgi:hypothetical protein
LSSATFSSIEAALPGILARQEQGRARPADSSASSALDFAWRTHQDGLEQHRRRQRADQRQDQELAYAGCARMARLPQAREAVAVVIAL